MNNVVAFIPARIGSKSIPEKNIKGLGDKPLIAYTIECAQKAGIQRIIVSTDSTKIAKCARVFGAEVMMRPKELAGDKTSMFEVVNSEIPKIEPVPEYVMLLQPTVPFRNSSNVKLAISMLSQQADRFDSLVSAEQLPDKYNPSQIIVSTPSGLRMASGAPISQRVQRRQDYPDAWIPTGAIYMFKTSNLEEGSMYGDNIMIMENETSINIDTEADWELAEKQING